MSDASYEMRAAAADWFAVDMEQCPWCDNFVPWDELISLIGTPMICPDCRIEEKLRRLDELTEAATWPMGLS